MSNPTAVITGITGQDGSYLCELLLEKNYIVHGLVRRASSLPRNRLDHLVFDRTVYNKSLFLHYADLDDTTTIRRILTRIKPSEVYHLAGQSHVGLSFEIPESTCSFTAMGTLKLLEILRDIDPTPRFFHASSSEVFGQPSESPQSENTKFCPINPYGCAKAFASNLVRVYREAHGLFAVNGILYNHESPRRGEHFVTQKICTSAAQIKLGALNELKLGEIESYRDWGDARQFVFGYWLSLQHSRAQDYVFATGQLHSVKDILDIAFSHVDLDWRNFVSQDKRLLRPMEPTKLLGCSKKARNDLGWRHPTPLRETIIDMVDHALKRQSDPINNSGVRS